MLSFLFESPMASYETRQIHVVPKVVCLTCVVGWVVCLFVCLFVGWLVGLFVCWFARMHVCLFD